MTKPFDLILMGATGYTGQLVAEYLVERLAATEQPLRWALAGRSMTKLESLRQSLAQRVPAAAGLPLLVADSLDREAIDAMVAQTRVVCATVGPYLRFGTPLVAACAEQGVDYCDITGEVPWIRQNIDAFHIKAQGTGARIVHCCGYDSIPSDLGTLLVQIAAADAAGRPATAVKHLIGPASGGFSGGTAATMLNLLEQSQHDRSLRRTLANPFALLPDGKSPDGRQVEDQTGPRFDADFGRWTAPFLMATINSRIVHRSNALLGFRYGRSFDFRENMRMGTGIRGRLAATSFSVGLSAVALVGMLGTRLGLRRIMQGTLVPAPGEGPSRKTRENGFFRSTLLGKVPAAEGQPETWIRGKIAGVQDPGYGETAKMLGESALCLALDADIPADGGILTPAASMGLRLVDRLCAAGMTFTAEPWRPSNQA